MFFDTCNSKGGKFIKNKKTKIIEIRKEQKYEKENKNFSSNYVNYGNDFWYEH